VVKLDRVLMRRLGGVALLLIGVAFLVGPIQVLFGGTHGAAQDPKARHAILDAMIYQLTLGGVVMLFGAYFLTVKPKTNTTAKTDAADRPSA
jgi:drug/metabolite transporter (DMT)-like permease